MKLVKWGKGLTIVLLFLALIASCTGAPGLGKYKLSLSPSALKVGENAIDLLVTDGQGNPATDLTISFAVVHRTMEMAKQVVAASHKGDGHYQGIITIAHSGSWVVFVDAVQGGQRLGRREFGFDIGP